MHYDLSYQERVLLAAFRISMESSVKRGYFSHPFIVVSGESILGSDSDLVRELYNIEINLRTTLTNR